MQAPTWLPALHVYLALKVPMARSHFLRQTQTCPIRQVFHFLNCTFHAGSGSFRSSNNDDKDDADEDTQDNNNNKFATTSWS